MNFRTHWGRASWRMGVLAMALVICGLLVACGGGTPGTTGSSAADNKDAAAAQSSSEQSAASVQTELSKGASLSTAELAAAEKAAEAADTSGSAVPLEEVKERQTVPKSAYTSGEVARKAAAVRIPVWRFYNTKTGAHFFTTSASERDNVQAKMSPPYSYEGEAFSVASDFSVGLSAVHRFYNTQTGVHFYTISEAERANVAANLPAFTYEGVAYYASQVAGAGLIPFYRFYLPKKGFHFYTANEAEKANLIAHASGTYSYEGVGYYVLDTNWAAGKGLPHSGVTNLQCYQAGSNTLVACSTSAAKALNPQQDGHRTAVNAMSYAQVWTVSGMLFVLQPKTSCVWDSVTGLVWEGKTDDGGLRDMDNRYTNLNNGQTNDTSGYVAAVNAAKLCGYSDWRLPTRQELLSIVDYGRTNAPSINTDWFPHTMGTEHWSSDVESENDSKAFLVSFDYGLSGYQSRSTSYAVRLVRGSSPSGPRFTYSTETYGSDAPNNLVNDAWTGLQWRRCEEWRTWDGSKCTGPEVTSTHEVVLVYARDHAGWRLPNVKELASLVDLSVASGRRIDATAFPGAFSAGYSSSPNVRDSSTVWTVRFGTGVVIPEGRGFPGGSFRLVRSSP